MSDLTSMDGGNHISMVGNRNTQRNANGEVGQRDSATTDQRENFQIGQSRNDDDSAFSFSNMSKRQKYLLVISFGAIFVSSLAKAILGPVYPTEGEKKGMSTTLIGLVVGSSGLVVAVTSPIFGGYLNQLGPRRMYFVGIIVEGLCNIVFGTLDYVPYGAPFIVASIVCRSVEAVGFCAFVTSCYAIISSEFVNKIGVPFGILMAAAGIGFVAGPLTGGALFEVGGYGLPFYVMGGVTIVNGVLAYRFLPIIENVETNRQRSIFHLVRSPLLIIPMFSLIVGMVGITNLTATFAKHIQDHFDLSSTMVGLIFVIAPLAFSVASPALGYLTDKKNFQAALLVVGHIIFAIGFLLIGPKAMLPFVPFKLWIVCIGLVLIGTSGTCFFIPTMKCMVQGVTELELGDNTDTYAMVSGLFNSMQSIGGLLGPVAVGALVDAFGHHVAYTTVGMLSLFMAIVCCTLFSIWYGRTGTPRQYSLDHDANEGKKNRAFVLDPTGDLDWPHGNNVELR